LLPGADPTWRLRRRATFGALLFGAAIVAYVALRWDSTSLAETLALGAFGLMGAVVAAYTGAAAYQDVRDPYGRGTRPLPYTEGPPSSESDHV
jgi:uncharacterized membrane protein